MRTHRLRAFPGWQRGRPQIEYGLLTCPAGRKELRQCDDLDWITALRAPAITSLASDDGRLQPSLFDIRNLAEITHLNYPGERSPRRCKRDA